MAIVAFVVICFGVGDENAFFGSYDVREVFAYQKAFFSKTIIDGRLPLWNPHTFGGWPFLANPQAQVFYPTSLLYLWMPLPQALISELILHLLLAAFGTYALARYAYGISQGSSVLAALTFCLSGTVFGHVYRGHPHIIMSLSYIPLLSLAIDRAATHFAGIQSWRTERSDNSVGISFRRLWQTLADIGPWPWPWLASLLLALQLLTGGLQMVWLGMLFIGLSRLVHLIFCAAPDWRRWSREVLLLFGVSLVGLCVAAAQLMPSLELAQLSSRPLQDYAYAATASYEPRQLQTMLNPGVTPDGAPAPGGNYGYAGLLTIVLTFFGIIAALRDRRLAVLLPVGVFFFLFMLGSYAFLFPLLFKYFPTVDVFRAPARAMTIVHLIMSLLAAAGLDAIIRRLFGRTRRYTWAAPATIICVCAIVWLDLVYVAQMKKELLTIPEHQTLDSPEQVSHARILQQDPSWFRYWFYPGRLRDNHAFAVDARSVGGYDVMIPGRFERFIRFMTDAELEQTGLTRLNPKSFVTTPSPFPFKILGVKYVDYGDQVVTRQEPGAQQSLSRGWFVNEVKWVENEIEALRLMRSDNFKPYREVVFEAAVSESLNKAAAQNLARREPVEVRVTELTPEQLIVQVAPHASGYLVLAEMFYPGWRAEIDGVRLPMHRCNSILRCLQLEDSATPVQITIEFRPTSLRLGLAVSLTSISIVFLGLFGVRRKSNDPR